MHVIPLFLEEAARWISRITVHVRSDIVEDQDHQVVLVRKLLQVLRMLQQEIRSLDEVHVTIRLNEVVTHRLDVVYDHQLDLFVLNSLGQVDEHLVVFFQGLAMGEDDVFSDLLLRNFIFILAQEMLFYFVESLFI